MTADQPDLLSQSCHDRATCHLHGAWPAPQPGSHESDLVREREAEGFQFGQPIAGLPGTDADESYWAARRWSEKAAA